MYSWEITAFVKPINSTVFGSAQDDPPGTHLHAVSKSVRSLSQPVHCDPFTCRTSVKKELLLHEHVVRTAEEESASTSSAGHRFLVCLVTEFSFLELKRVNEYSLLPLELCWMGLKNRPSATGN